jgi:hypothetical protein
MFELKNKYISDYWFNDNIIDCGKSINNISDEIPVIISDSDVNIITHNYIEHLFEEPNNYLSNSMKQNTVNKEKINNLIQITNFEDEKLNNNYKISNTQIYNNEYKSKKNSLHSKYNNSDISTRNREYYNQSKSGRQIISNNRMFDMEKTSEHFKLFNESSINYNKGNMYKLPKTSRIHEFITERRKVLLDSQPKPTSLKT